MFFSNAGDALPPSSDDNNPGVILSLLKDAAGDWGAKFDGNKIVLVVDHLSSNADFNGDAKALLEFLELTGNEGLDLKWSRATINYRIYGYGCGPEWIGYDWSSPEEEKMTMTLRDDWDDNEDDLEGEYHAYEDYDDGDVELDAQSEMIPSNFYENERCEETFEADYTYHGVYGKRQYDYQRVIVFWPKSRNWTVIANGDLGDMCKMLLEEGPDGKRVKMLLELVLEQNKDRKGLRDSLVSSFIKALVELGNPEVAVSFWVDFLAKGKQRGCVPSEILPQLGPFMQAFGSEGDIKFALQDSLPKEIIKRDPDKVIHFVSTLVQSLNEGDFPCQLMIEKIVGCLDQLQAAISAPAAKAFFAIFENGRNGIMDGANSISTFVDGVTKVSSELKVVKRGPFVFVALAPRMFVPLSSGRELKNLFCGPSRSLSSVVPSRTH